MDCFVCKIRTKYDICSECKKVYCDFAGCSALNECKFCKDISILHQNEDEKVEPFSDDVQPEVAKKNYFQQLKDWLLWFYILFKNKIKLFIFLFIMIILIIYNITSLYLRHQNLFERFLNLQNDYNYCIYYKVFY